jgi:hypothetical protein
VKHQLVHVRRPGAFGHAPAAVFVAHRRRLLAGPPAHAGQRSRALGRRAHGSGVEVGDLRSRIWGSGFEV